MCYVNWAEVEAIGTWVAGIGTIGTVFVALHLARKSQVGRVRLVAGFRVITRNILFIKVTNIGSRNLKIDRIAWRLRKPNKNRTVWRRRKNNEKWLILFQPINSPQVDSLPKTLSDGEDIYFELEKVEWISGFITQVGNEDKSLLDEKVLNSLQFGASATNGQDFWQDAESAVKAALVKEAQSFLQKNGDEKK
jgi:hypothetical protein